MIFLALAAVIVAIILSGIRIVIQFERGMVFTLGRFSKTVAPGLHIIIPVIQKMHKVDMRIRTIDVSKQEVITKDNIPIYINAVVNFRVVRPEEAVIEVADFIFAVIQLTQSALKDVVGNNDLDAILSDRKTLGEEIKNIVDEATSEWGVDIKTISLQEVELPEDMKRAMAKQAEAERNRRAMIIAADGELESSAKILSAAQTLAKSPITMQLKTLQTIKDISNNPSQKIILFPAELTEILSKK